MSIENDPRVRESFRICENFEDAMTELDREAQGTMDQLHGMIEELAQEVEDLQDQVEEGQMAREDARFIIRVHGYLEALHRTSGILLNEVENSDTLSRARARRDADPEADISPGGTA